ncbi:ABC transporter permease [Quadrisphaera sp. DSM 44207]|uniref:ABC transporter permease n=1 Tax=Quadrisphaera sp. DSM 44207 TaxID=1881057 RepID=UPI00088D0644|nr:ABC transporter permease [Quadrisphaera sp. DSM 44207]SDQ11888.1 nucleoside ABC transporter membrane protein [Quadrisphaera sp. DSM 44207]
MSTPSTLAPERAATATPGPATARRSWKQPVVLGVLALAALVGFGLLPAGGLRSTFALALGSEAVQLPPVAVPSRAAAVVLALLCAAVAAWSAVLARAGRRTPAWATALFGVAWVLAFLCWAVAGRSIPFTGLLRGTLLLAVPLVFGALAGVLCERAGVINIAIEGQLLAGAFASAVVASLTDSAYAGLLAAPLAGLVVGALLGLFSLRYLVDQTIVGVVLNVLVIGFTSFLYGQLLAPEADTFNTPPVLASLPVPLLSQVPVLGPVLFDQSIVVYLMYAVVAVVHVALFRTRWGLRVRAVGEHPRAADTLGVRVLAVRWRNVLLGGAVAGLGGAFFTLGRVGAFGEEMTAGQGFIAIAAMIFGRWKPLGALGAALLFGFAYSLQQTLSTIDFPVPGQLMLMLPYLATILAVAGLVGRVRAPAADGVPYGKG